MDLWRLMKNRALAVAVVVGALIGLGVGVGVSPLIYPPRVETQTFTTTAAPSTFTTTVTAGRTPQRVVFWDGNGAGPDTALVTFEDYYQLCSQLSGRFGHLLMAVGLRDEEDAIDKWNKWIVVLQDLWLSADDIGFTRSLFPERVSLQIVGVKDCEVRVIGTLPPIVQVIC